MMSPVVSVMFAIRKKVRPPLTTAQQVDIELLMRKTIAQLGLDFVRKADVITALAELRLDQSSPDRLLDSAANEVEQRLPRIDSPCVVLAVDRSQLNLPSKYQPPTSDSPARISIADDTLADSLRTVMELSYQYANHYWQATDKPTPLDTDPRTTNLLPICCGLGVLASDACFYDQQWTQPGWSGWSISRSGYYTAVELGYALALFARARGQVQPRWAQSLRLDSRVTAQKAWRYFARHEQAGGCLLFDADPIPASTCDPRRLAQWLQGQDPAFALAAAYVLAKQDELSPLIIEAAIDATRRPDQDLVAAAARLLGKTRCSDPATVARVRQLIRAAPPQTSLAAIQSAAQLGIPLSEFSARIQKLLDRLGPHSLPLLQVIGTQGPVLASLGPRICEHAGRAIRQMDREWTDALLDCLQRIVDDPRRQLEMRIKSPAIRDQALRRLDGQQR